MIKCPQCNGTCTELASHVQYSDGTHGYGVKLPCLRCEGRGQVPDEMPLWIEAGHRMKLWRFSPYRSLREEALRRGMKASELSAMETGRREPVLSDEQKAVEGTVTT